MTRRRIRSCLLTVLVLLLVADIFIARHLLADRYRYIVVHHSASGHDDYASIKSFHARRFLADDAAYHLFLSNGSTEVPHGHLEASNRYRDLSYAIATRSPRYNQQGLHLCLVGDFEQFAPSAEMAAAAGHALILLSERYDVPAERILFHRDMGATACPGRFVTREAVVRWMREDAANCPPDVARQQAAVVADCGLSWRTVPEVAMILVGLLNLVVALGGFLVCRRRSRRRRAVFAINTPGS